MSYLPLDSPNEEKKPRRKFKLLKIQLFSVAVLLALVTGTFATNINVNSGGRIEFGQGSVQVVTCDTYINVNLDTEIDATTGQTYIDRVTLSDLSVQLHDRTVSVELYGEDGTKLNSNLSFSVDTDGLTYTSTRAHTDTIDAFTLGGGERAERGVNQIVFTNFASEEPARIEAKKFARVALQTSGSGTCSVPSNIPAVAVYFDAPYVQGSYIAEDFAALTQTDTYDEITLTDRPCSDFPSNLYVGTYSGNACRIFTREQDNYYYQWGGAIQTSSAPTQGGSPNALDQSPSAFVGTDAGETISFSSSRNYVGLWWSAGSFGNNIKFYRNNVLYTTVTGNDVYSRIPNSNSTISAINNSTYIGENYYGHPLISSMGSGEPYVFMHIFALNGFNFDSLNISTEPGANGFEWDNLSVANLRTTDLIPKNTLVFVAQYTYDE